MALKLKDSLTKTQKKNLQRRLSHFLRHHQQKNDLLLKDVAKKLDYTPPKFADLCRSDKPHGRFISSLDFLKSLADLEKLSIGQLVTFLEEGEQQNTERTDKDELLIKAFKVLKASHRKELNEFLNKSNRVNTQERELFRELLEVLMILIKKNDLSKVKAIKEMIS